MAGVAADRRGGKLKLSVKQKAFADEYLQHGNAKLAYTRAGYTGTDGKGHLAATTVLQQPVVRRYIAECQAKVTERAIATRSERLAILSDIVRGTSDARPDQVNAAKLMAQMEGELVHRVAGASGGPIEINAMSTHELLAIIARFK